MARQLRLWGIVLAGGEGTRIRQWVENRLGESRPKQYCTFVGAVSMLEQTLDRALHLTDPERILTVIGPGHRVHLAGLRRHPLPGTVLEQPRSLETAPGVFLPLVHVLAREPDAIVVVMPSDHFMDPEERVVEVLERAARLAAVVDDRILLLAAMPEGPETDYGWIQPGTPAGGEAAGSGALEVEAFREKPSAADARAYYRRGFLWNTMIVAARAGTLWELGTRTLGTMTRRFELLQHFLMALRQGDVRRDHLWPVLEQVYAGLSPANFSRDLLEKVTSRTLVLPLEGVHWSDWGRPERIWASLTRLGAPLPVAGGP